MLLVNTLLLLPPLGNRFTIFFMPSRLGINHIEQSPLGNSDVAARFVDHPVVLLHVVPHEEGVAREEEVDLLEGASADFGVDEVDDGEEYCHCTIRLEGRKKGRILRVGRWMGRLTKVETSENDECLPSQSVKHDRDDECVHAAPDSPISIQYSISALASLNNQISPDISAYNKLTIPKS